MTAAEILALPVQVSPLIRRASDTGFLYAIAAGFDGSAAVVLDTSNAAINAAIAESPETTKEALDLSLDDIPVRTAATATLDPSGADNTIIVTAKEKGLSGNAISVQIWIDDEDARETVSVIDEGGGSYYVSVGDKSAMQITGTLTSDGSTTLVFGRLQRTGLMGDRSKYGYPTTLSPEQWIGTVSGKWTIYINYGTPVFESTDPVATPDLVTTWTPVGTATGTPIVTAFPASATTVIDKINGGLSGPSSTAWPFTAIGDGSTAGSVADVAPTMLTGGTEVPVTPTSIGALTPSGLASGTIIPKTGDLDLNNFEETVNVVGVVTTAHTFDISTGNRQRVRLTASTACACTMPTPTDGSSFTVEVEQAAVTGGGSATFTDVDWGADGPPSITSTAGKMDIVSFMANGSKWFGSYKQGYTY